MTDTATLTEARPFALGDVITYTENGSDYTGTVYGIHTNESPGVDGGPDPYPALWVGNTEPFHAYPHVHTVMSARQNYPQGERNTWKDTGTGGELEGHWVSTRYDSPRLTFATEDTERATEEERSHRQALDTITELRAQVSDLQSQVDAARTVIEQVGSALAETADESEWCGEYDRRVRDLYDVLPGTGGFDNVFRQAALRNHSYTVTWSASGTYDITARNEEDAREVFAANFGRYVYGSDVEVIDVEQEEE